MLLWSLGFCGHRAQNRFPRNHGSVPVGQRAVLLQSHEGDEYADGAGNEQQVRRAAARGVAAGASRSPVTVTQGECAAGA